MASIRVEDKMAAHASHSRASSIQKSRTNIASLREDDIGKSKLELANRTMSTPMVTQVQILSDFQEMINSIKLPEVKQIFKKDKQRKDSKETFQRQFSRTLESITGSFAEFQNLNKKTADFVIKRMVRTNMKFFVRKLKDSVTLQYGIEAYDHIKSFMGSPFDCELLASPLEPGEKYNKTIFEMAEKRQLLNISNHEEFKKLIFTHTHAWGPDVFRLNDISNQRVLSFLACSLFSERDFFRKFCIPADTFFQYMLAAESRYLAEVRYHNAVHAADVMQSAHMLMNVANVSDFEVLALLFACAIHDIAHPGFTNPFMVASESHMAELYNAESVLENFHYETGIKLLNEEGCDFLVNMTRQQRIALKRLVKILILATDMSNHIDILSVFKQTLYKKRDKHDGSCHLTENQDVLCFLIHVADVSNPLKPLPIYKQWIERLEFEFFKQGDIERERGVKISPMCDRHTVNFELSQSFFIEVVVKPLVDNLNQYAPPCTCLTILTEHMNFNLEYFKNMKVKKNSTSGTLTSDSSKVARSRRTSSAMIERLNTTIMSSPTQSPIPSQEKIPLIFFTRPSIRKKKVHRNKPVFETKIRSIFDSGKNSFDCLRFTRPAMYPNLSDALVIQEVFAKEQDQKKKDIDSLKQ